MKVLILAPHSSPIVTRLVESLKKRGDINVVLASFNAVGKEGVEDLGPLNSMLDYLKFWKVSKLVQRHKPDLIHAHISTHYGMLALFARVPVVVALWGSEIMLDSFSGSRPKQFLFRFFNYLAFRNSKCCHTSGRHIAETAFKISDIIRNKVHVFYWGFPLKASAKESLEEIGRRMKKEFLLDEKELIVFPRGLSPVYNPKLTALLADKLARNSRISHTIVVLKGFASKSELELFKSYLQSPDIVVIERLLTEAELYWLYTKTSFHFSIPFSDALGGGVIEPSLLGSYPILSDIPSYNDFINTHCGYLLKNNLSLNELDLLIEFMCSKPSVPDSLYLSYGENKITEQIVDIYSKALAK